MQMKLIPDEVAAAPQFTQETWREVSEFPSYEVSSEGRFRNKRSGRFLTGTVSHNGYVHIGLKKEQGRGSQLWRLAHRLVAEAFLPKQPGQRVVNHINGKRADNRACNLEWSSDRANALHWIERKRSGAVCESARDPATVCQESSMSACVLAGQAAYPNSHAVRILVTVP